MSTSATDGYGCRSHPPHSTKVHTKGKPALNTGIDFWNHLNHTSSRLLNENPFILRLWYYIVQSEIPV